MSAFRALRKMLFLFGAVYVQAAPEKYVQFAHDYNRLRKLPSNLALGVFSNPATLSDLKGFTFDNDDIKALKNCKPGNCLLQMPEGSIEELQKSVNWSAADVSDEVNQQLQKGALQRLLAYQRDGNRALGVYVDKPNPIDVSKQLSHMVGYSKVLPFYLPDFYHYLLDHPEGKPTNVENSFYWARVKFGLKPTLLGSEQAGLTGAKGSIVRRAAVGRSVSNLQTGLTTIKNTLEASH